MFEKNYFLYSTALLIVSLCAFYRNPTVQGISVTYIELKKYFFSSLFRFLKPKV